jgi:response regulator RpfG family c-di-GMP phosphodiesterase
MNEHIPKVLVYDDKENQAKDVKELLGEQFDTYIATPTSLETELRANIDVVVSDVEIIEEGKPERQGYDDIEKILKDSNMDVPVIVYTTVANLERLKNSPRGKFFFDYVERNRDWEWESELAAKIWKAYADRFRQASKMFAYWFEQCGILDKKVSEGGIDRLVKSQAIHDDDLESARGYTYKIIIGWLDVDYLEDDVERDIKDILWDALKDNECFKSE